jgi:hypothetical protein
MDDSFDEWNLAGPADRMTRAAGGDIITETCGEVFFYR